MKIRPAKVSDVKAMQAAIKHFADKREMLPRSLNDLYENLFEFFVAEDSDGKFAGCAAIHISWEDLAEVKGLAVAPEHQGKGMGKKLVEACEAKAKAAGVKKIFALTFKPAFFEKVGYTKIERDSLPHKVWGECIKCPMFPDCGEVAVSKQIDENPAGL